MESASSASGPVDIGTLSDQELARVFLQDRANNEVEQQLLTRCLKKIAVAIRVCNIVPDFLIDDAFSLAQVNLCHGIGDLCYPEKLHGWLIELARNAAITVRRKHFGRGGGQREFAPLESPNPGSQVVQTLDLEKNREAAQRYAFRSRYWQDPEQLVVDRELSEVFLAALRVHAQGSKRDADCALWMEIQLHEETSIAEIAERRGTTKDDVWHLFGHDQEMLRLIFTERFNMSLRDLL